MDETEPSTRFAHPARESGYAPLRNYAAIGDGRTVALVSLDGSIDWLPFPDLDSPTVFARLLDARRGGFCSLRPTSQFMVSRRYLPGTNVLETTFRTSEGTVRVTDAMPLPTNGLAPYREIIRRIEGLSGRVQMSWNVEPRFDYARRQPRARSERGAVVFRAAGDALVLTSFDAGAPEVDRAAARGTFNIEHGRTAVLVLAGAHGEPAVVPGRPEVERRLRDTSSFWERWSDQRSYDGPWRADVARSALTLKLLAFAPSGAIAAAATTSLPEQMGGGANWDYRFAWIRDAAFTVGSLLELGCSQEARAYFWWLMHASQLTAPELRVLYRLDGGIRATERELRLEGYRGSRPVRIGNAAASQRQLDTYGELMEAAWQFARSEGGLDPDIGSRLAAVADLVCRVWRLPDHGIWELRGDLRHHTQSKMMCWVALDRAARMADRRLIPARRQQVWIRTAAEVRRFVEEHCWSDRRGSYIMAADGDDMDASVLLGLLYGMVPFDAPRGRATIAAVQRELAEGPLVFRLSSAAGNGTAPREGAFLACSFWLIEALSRSGRADEAAELMGGLLSKGNDVGVWPEEIDVRSGDFLGNLPQALSHLALISAAASFPRDA